MVDGPQKSVFVLAADRSTRESLDGSQVPCGMSLTHFTTAADCRDALQEDPCHLLVMSLYGNAVEGLQLLGDSEPALIRIPKLALVDQGDIATAVKAIRAGAINCLEEPVEIERLLAEIRTILQDDPCLRETLTPMETTVLRLLLEGKTNGETARVLHRSSRTVEVHRGHIMRKLGVSNMVDLVKIAALMGHFRLFDWCAFATCQQGTVSRDN